ncbi:MAG: MBL fold metallo-hydrolase [Elusimicrobia bacterium]|nr:MBL fold metallo-hydrolase [Elusimicrobiota bacterium]
MTASPAVSIFKTLGPRDGSRAGPWRGGGIEPDTDVVSIDVPRGHRRGHRFAASGGVRGHAALFDCGLYQGHRHEALVKNRTFPVDPKTIKAVLLSHAHIDHSGGLPLLVKEGFAGPIHCTDATAELLKIMLMDSAMIQEEDAKFFNKLHAAEGLTIDPLYTQEDVEHTLALLEPRPYGALISIADGVDASFSNAGHVLGSAMVHVGIKTLKRKRHLLFTGDLGRRESILMEPPENSRARRLPDHGIHLRRTAARAHRRGRILSGRRHQPIGKTRARS